MYKCTLDERLSGIAEFFLRGHPTLHLYSLKVLLLQFHLPMADRHPMEQKV